MILKKNEYGRIFYNIVFQGWDLYKFYYSIVLKIWIFYIKMTLFISIFVFSDFDKMKRLKDYFSQKLYFFINILKY